MARGQTATEPELAIKISIGKFCDVIAIGSVYYFWTRQLQCCLCNLLNVKLQTGFANSASTAAAATTITATALPTTIADTQTSLPTAGAAVPYRDKQHAPLAEATHDYPYTARHNTCADLHSPTLTLHYLQLTYSDLHLHCTTQNILTLTLTYTYSYTYIIYTLTLVLTLTPTIHLHLHQHLLLHLLLHLHLHLHLYLHLHCHTYTERKDYIHILCVCNFRLPFRFHLPTQRDER